MQELSDLRNRIEWLEEERRKTARKLSEMEQRVTLQNRELNGREQRIQDLERQLASVTIQIGRIPQVDTQLAQFKDDIVKMIDQYDQRRLQSESELDRLRRVEHEGTLREIADLRKEISVIAQLRNELDQRQAEDNRLSTMLSNQQTKLSSLTARNDDLQNAQTFLEEKEKHNNRNIAELQTSSHEFTKRIEQLQTRIDATNTAILRVDPRINEISEKQRTVQDTTKNWMEQIQIGEYERNQKLEKWRQLLEDEEKSRDRFSKEWIKISDQYKEAQMAVQTLTQWQEQIEKQQREAAEMIRMESHRAQSRWDDFVLQNQKLVKNLEVESEQRWSTANRHESELRELIDMLQEQLTKLEQEKDLLWRVQNAQTDALKQFPLKWIEEVDKAIQQNPNRRRQPALVPVSEE